jgi:hypothetical protein
VYDSNFRLVSGTGANTTIESFTYDVDVNFHVYLIGQENTEAGDWQFGLPWSNGGVPEFEYTMLWRSLEDPDATAYSSTQLLDHGLMYKLNTQSGANSSGDTQRMASRTNFILMAGDTAEFRSITSASAAQSAVYRVIAEKADSALMLTRFYI